MSGMTSGGSGRMTVVCWNASDAGCLTDRLRGARQIRGKTFVETTAPIGDSTLVVLELIGAKPSQSLSDALTVNRSPWVVLAGAAETLTGHVPLDTIVLPRWFRIGDQLQPLPTILSVDRPLPARTAWGTLDGSATRPTVPGTVAGSSQDASGGSFDELVVWARPLGDLVGECERLGVPWTAVLSLRHNARRPAVRDVEAVKRQAGWAGKLGAAAAAVWRRPRVALDLVHQQQHDLVAGDRLADFIISLH